MKVYLIVLQGQGDTDVRVVDKETFDWVTSTNPGMLAEAKGNAWIDSRVPEYQQKKREEDGLGSLELTTGSWWNDRMLAAYSIHGYKEYSSLRDALKAVKAKGDEIEDTTEGMIY
jgi:hypothetical protein